MIRNIAVVGATGAVGRLIRQLLVERDFPYERIKFLASARSAGSSPPGYSVNWAGRCDSKTTT